MKHLFAGIAALLFGLGATQANAFTITAPSGMTAGDSFSVQVDASMSGLVGLDFYVSMDPALLALDSVTDVADGGTPGTYVNLGINPAISLTNGLDFVPASASQGFTIVGAVPSAGAPAVSGFEVFDLNFLSSAIATDTVVSFLSYAYLAGATSPLTFSGNIAIDFDAPAIPLPAGAPLVISGLAALAMLRRRKAKAA